MKGVNHNVAAGGGPPGILFTPRSFSIPETAILIVAGTSILIVA